MPFTEEEYTLLYGGPEGIARWNALRKSEERKGELPDLSEAMLLGAKLSGADLSGALLNGVALIGSDLSGADLSGAKLVQAELSGADLSGANLTGALLTMADLTNTLLCGAALGDVDLESALLKWTDLTDANIENAIITDIVRHELNGLPRPPSRLRLWRDGEEIVLTGDEAANFFVLSAVVEVCLTQTLADLEFSGLFAHFAEMRANSVATDVYMIGHRREREGSVLRFQGPTYEAVYAALPDLLAPFRTSAAIDWKVTLDSIPKDDRLEALTALVKTEARLVKGRWAIAERLAQSFEGFANTRVVRLAEGRNKGVSITVATDDTMIERVAWALLPVTAHNAAIVINGSAEFHGGQHMGDNTNVKAGAIVGSNIGTGNSVTAGGDIAAEINQISSSAVAELTGVVKQALQLLADTPLTKADREKAEKNVEDIQVEAKKTPPDAERAGKIKGWLDSLGKLCKPAADLISGAKVVIAALGLSG